VLMAAGAIGLHHVELGVGLGNGLDQATATREAQTAAVTAIIAFQIFYLLSCRSLKRTVLSIGVFSNPVVFVGVGAILVLQLGFVYLPFMQHLFGSAPLGPEAWLRAFVVGALVWPVVTIEKAVRRQRERRSPQGTRDRGLADSSGREARRPM